MKTKPKLLLFKVTWVHRDGYQAPIEMIEAETKEKAHMAMSRSKHVFLRYPDSWSYRLTDTRKTLVEGRWV